MPEYAHYHVGQKALIKKDGQFLFLEDARTGLLDLPGGRIDTEEDTKPLRDVLQRELQEELGDVVCEIGKPIFVYRRTIPQKNIRVFLTVYEATYIRGDITLSSEAKSFTWIDPKEYEFSKKQFSGDEEFQVFVNYFS